MKEVKADIKDLKRDDRVNRVFLVTAKELKKDKNNRDYLTLELADKTGRIQAKVWDGSIGMVARVGPMFNKEDFIQVAGTVEEYKGTLQINISELKKADAAKVDLSEFVPHTTQDVELLWAQVAETAEAIQDKYLAQLVGAFLEDEEFVKLFKHAPASIKHHQPYVGGLMEHTVKMLNLSQSLLVGYPALNRDLLLTGILLHDIGKVQEYQLRLKPEHTDEGRLVGHTALGLLLIEEKVRGIKEFPAELLRQLRHLILSHHGEKIYGAPVLPMTAEALALHFLDNLDARLAEYYEQTAVLPSDSNWTGWLESMERRFYRPGNNKD